MGVTGLWKLIDSCGKPVPVETLEGKILSVDLSIWLHQVTKGFQDNKGSALENAHLLGLFHRLCKLLYCRVRPVFVFDGCTPQLKRETIARRQQQRNKLSKEADRIQALVLQSLAQEKVVQQALGSSAAELLKSPVKRKSNNSKAEDDIFKLPECPAAALAHEPADDSLQEHESDYNDCSMTGSSSTEDSSFDETSLRHAYNANLQAIDVRSAHFQTLPANIRHEILKDIKETRKQSSWGRLHELPSRGGDFSTFQMKRLLKRRAVQVSLEEAEQELGGQTLTFNELKTFFAEENIIEATAIEKGAKALCSDENTRYLLVRDIKKKLNKEEAEANIKEKETDEENQELPVVVQKEQANSTSESMQLDEELPCSSSTSKVNGLSNEYDKDLQLAIALSMEDTKVYNDEDYDYDADAALRLNREQRKHLQNAAIGPARAYMLEYGGMNEDEVVGIMDKTQKHNDLEQSEFFESFSMPNAAQETRISSQTILISSDDEGAALNVKATKNAVCAEEDALEKCNMEATVPLKQDDLKGDNNSEEAALGKEVTVVVSDCSDSDADFEEVLDSEEYASANKTALEILVDLKQPLQDDEDMFADDFVVNESGKELKQKDDASLTQEKDVIMPEQGAAAVNENAAPMKNDESTKLSNILASLHKQYEEVKNLSLNDIKEKYKPKSEELLAANVEADTTTDCKSERIETIEICDDDGDASSSSKLGKTPTKNNKNIQEYFELEYKIKRTPEQGRETSPVPSKKSPFFVNKTPKSSHKKSSGKSSARASPTGKMNNKVAKSLFPEAPAQMQPNNMDKVQPQTAESLLQEAAEALKAHKTQEQLEAMASSLAKQKSDLEMERNRQQRMGASINERMHLDCQELLRLFGVPYLVAPMEAEAQCAFLDAVELTNGTITDDSDIWLFGGRTVYKNFFEQTKHVMEFRAHNIEQKFQCDRSKLIQLACLVGSDYTTGVHGIGTVTALEILASFSITNEPSGKNLSQLTLSTLNRFRDWWLANKTTVLPPGSSARLALWKKLKNIELHEGFPSLAVVEAYLSPNVDQSKEAFSWGNPDFESIREFTKKRFGWTRSKTDDILMPVLKKLNEKKLQANIRSYFSVKSALPAQQPLHVSKRVQKAIDKMSGKLQEETPEKIVKKASRKRKTNKASKLEDKTAEVELAAESNETNAEPTEALKGKRAKRVPVNKKTAVEHAQAVTSSTTAETETAEEQKLDNIAAILSARPKRAPRIPNTKQIIPQREKDLEEMRRNKEMAAEIFKKSKTTKK